MQETAVHADEQALYEVTFLQVREDPNAIRETLRTHNATIQEERPMEKVHLAYPIGKQTYAFMGSFRFTVDGNLPTGRQAESVSERLSERSGERVAMERGPRPFGSPTNEPLTNEALERKISEILQ